MAPEFGVGSEVTSSTGNVPPHPHSSSSVAKFCSLCGTECLLQYVEAFGETWHPFHFFCVDCGIELQVGFAFRDVDGSLHCLKHMKDPILMTFSSSGSQSLQSLFGNAPSSRSNPVPSPRWPSTPSISSSLGLEQRFIWKRRIQREQELKQNSLSLARDSLLQARSDKAKARHARRARASQRSPEPADMHLNLSSSPLISNADRSHSHSSSSTSESSSAATATSTPHSSSVEHSVHRKSSSSSSSKSKQNQRLSFHSLSQPTIPSTRLKSIEESQAAQAATVTAGRDRHDTGSSSGSFSIELHSPHDPQPRIAPGGGWFRRKSSLAVGAVSARTPSPPPLKNPISSISSSSSSSNAGGGSLKISSASEKRAKQLSNIERAAMLAVAGGGGGGGVADEESKFIPLTKHSSIESKPVSRSKANLPDSTSSENESTGSDEITPSWPPPRFAFRRSKDLEAKRKSFERKRTSIDGPSVGAGASPLLGPVEPSPAPAPAPEEGGEGSKHLANALNPLVQKSAASRLRSRFARAGSLAILSRRLTASTSTSSGGAPSGGDVDQVEEDDEEEFDSRRVSTNLPTLSLGSAAFQSRNHAASSQESPKPPPISGSGGLKANRLSTASSSESWSKTNVLENSALSAYALKKRRFLVMEYDREEIDRLKRLKSARATTRVARRDTRSSIRHRSSNSGGNSASTSGRNRGVSSISVVSESTLSINAEGDYGDNEIWIEEDEESSSDDEMELDLEASMESGASDADELMSLSSRASRSSSQYNFADRMSETLSVISEARSKERDPSLRSLTGKGGSHQSEEKDDGGASGSLLSPSKSTPNAVSQTAMSPSSSSTNHTSQISSSVSAEIYFPQTSRGEIVLPSRRRTKNASPKVSLSFVVKDPLLHKMTSGDGTGTLNEFPAPDLRELRYTESGSSGLSSPRHRRSSTSSLGIGVASGVSGAVGSENEDERVNLPTRRMKSSHTDTGMFSRLRRFRSGRNMTQTMNSVDPKWQGLSSGNIVIDEETEDEISKLDNSIDLVEADDGD